ncbi:MAG: hypothetical protein WBA00_11430 [Rhodococcus sp. (in: high G+C Gram-positive bacteria)]
MTTQPRKAAPKKASTSPAPSDTTKSETADTATEYSAPEHNGTVPALGAPAEHSDAPPVSLALYEEAANRLREDGIIPLIIEMDGHRFAVPKSVDDISGTAVDLISMNNLVGVLPFLLDPTCPDEGETFSELGKRQWDLFKSTKPKRPKYIELYRKWSNDQGFTPGE